MAGFDVTEGVVFALSRSVATAYLPNDASWDCQIGGLPFMFALDKERPMQRETASFRHDRIDQEREPGEQSLDSGLWLRSVSSFHYGAGQRSQEALEVDPAISRFRFYRSANVDGWTPGVATTGKAVSTLRSSATTEQHVLGIDGTNVLHSTDDTLNQVDNTGSATSVTWGGTGTITSLTDDGTNYYAADDTGIYSGALPAGAGSKVWDTGATTVARFVKSRLMAGIGNSVYELLTGGPTLPTALYDHPNTAWVWTDIAEGPNGIYFSGYAGPQSAIYRSTISASGSTITLGAPIVVADLPRGEIVHSIYGYLGTFLAIGTSLGLRVATFNTDGSLNVGPLTFTATGGVYDHVGYDRYLYVTGGSEVTGLDDATGPGLYRVDLSVEVDTLRYAYAQECVGSGDAAPSSVTIMGTQVVYTVPSTGLIGQSSDGDYATDAWVEYGKINFSTTENKAWRSVIVRASCPVGTSVEVHVSTTGTGAPSTWPIVGTLSDTATDGEFSLDVPAPTPTQSLYVALRLTGTATAQPTVSGVTVRAVPSPRRTRLMEIPLLCFDHETDRTGTMRGYTGGGWDRLSALEAVEESGDVVTWQDYTTGERRSVVIEKVAWTRVTPPSRQNDNAGGILTLTLRLL